MRGELGADGRRAPEKARHLAMMEWVRSPKSHNRAGLRAWTSGVVGVVLPGQIGKLPAKQPKDVALEVRQGLKQDVHRS